MIPPVIAGSENVPGAGGFIKDAPQTGGMTRFEWSSVNSVRTEPAAPYIHGTPFLTQASLIRYTSRVRNYRFHPERYRQSVISSSIFE